jgi:phage tail-like protein
MSRGTVSGLATPVDLLSQLPGIYRDHGVNVWRFTEAFDELLAPAWLVLDNLEDYFDPSLTPLDFLHVLAAWVGLPVDGNWREEQTRRLVSRAVQLYQWRGTRRGVAALVEAYTGIVPEIEESGGVAWSLASGAPPPGESEPSVRIRVELPGDAEEDLVRLTKLIAESVPAHVAVSVEIRRAGV